MKKEKLYLENLNHLFSYYCRIMAIVGARGIGKTYAVKKYCIKHFLCRDEKFVWLRDTDTAVDEVCTNNGEKFFNDIAKEFENLHGYIKNNAIMINDKLAGYVLPISTYYNYKGTSYEDIKTVVFDEFIPESVQYRVANRTKQFLNTLETIARMRKNVRIIMLANALDVSDELIKMLDIKIAGFGYYVNRNKSAVLWYADNSSKFNSERAGSLMGILASGTSFEENLCNNKFNDNASLYYEKRPTKCKLVCLLKNEDDTIRLYHKEGKIYVTRNVNTRISIAKYVNSIYLCDMEHRLISKEFKAKLKEHYTNGNVLFDNSYNKNTFLSIISA